MTRDFQFEDYDIEEVVAQGTGGVLYRAYRAHENAGRGRRDLIFRMSQSLARDINAVDRVRDTLERTNGVSHASLFATLHASYFPGHLVLVSSWDPSLSLAELDAHFASEGKRWPLPAALFVAAEIAKALSHLHVRGLMHGQIRPENVFITFDGQVKLLSLGMAAAESTAVGLRQGHVDGLANFTAPEQAAGHDDDGRSDLFSLGALLWGLLAGRPLYPPSPREEWIRVLNEKTPPPASQANPESPSELDGILAKLLDRDFRLRYELGERATNDLLAVLKFRYPDFTPAEFAAFCRASAGTFRDRYLAFVEGKVGAAEQTRAIEHPQPKPKPAAAPSTAPTITLEKPRPAARTFAPVEGPRPNIHQESLLFDKILSAQGMKIAAGIGLALLLAMPFVGPKALNRFRVQRAVANQGRAHAPELKATLHLYSKETDFAVEIDGKPADVVEGAVTVPANKDIQIVAKKEGYEDIENETALMPGEDYSINLEFKRLAAGEEPAK
jgi:hypothetical protein